MFRIGTTSYIIEDDLLPNTRWLADKVDDIELVLFDLDDGQSNLPNQETAVSMRHVADEHDLTFTVHLPLDIRLNDDGSVEHPSIHKAKKVIDCVRPLQPYAYVLHLDGRHVRGEDVPETAVLAWQQQSVTALNLLAECVDGFDKLAVENLEGYPLDFILPVVAQLPVQRCVDVGHLWLDGHDPLPYLHAALPRTSVIHLHGLDTRDHSSLVHMTNAQVDGIIHYLLAEKFAGVLSLEVFGEADFRSSLTAVHESMNRFTNQGRG